MQCVAFRLKMEKKTLVDFDICHRMALLRKLFSVTLIYFLKVKDLHQDLLTVVTSNHSSATRASKDSNRDLCKVENVPFLSEVEMFTKLFLQICLHLYVTRHRVAVANFLKTTLTLPLTLAGRFQGLHCTT